MRSRSFAQLPIQGHGVVLVFTNYSMSRQYLEQLDSQGGLADAARGGSANRIISQVVLRFERGAAAYFFQPFRLLRTLHPCPALPFAVLHARREIYLSTEFPSQIQVRSSHFVFTPESVPSQQSVSSQIHCIQVTLVSLPYQIRVAIQ